jgi:predicted aspartyl protease
MGAFYVECEIVNIRQPSRAVVVPKLLVDSGSELTRIPETALQRAGVRVVKKDLAVVMANGQRVTRSIGYAIVRAAGFETIDEVVFGQTGDLALLGARTLEGFGASVDARQKRLVAAGPYVAAPSGGQARS